MIVGFFRPGSFLRGLAPREIYGSTVQIADTTIMNCSRDKMIPDAWYLRGRSGTLRATGFVISLEFFLSFGCRLRTRPFSLSGALSPLRALRIQAKNKDNRSKLPSDRTSLQ